MYNNKCKNTFLFITSLLGLITLILPFMNVGYKLGTSLLLKIFYYIFIVIFVISLVVIVLVGIISLFKNNYILISVMEALSFTALISLTILVLIFLPSKAGLTVGFSLLYLETFVLACFDSILKLIKKLPRTFAKIKKSMDENAKQRTKQNELVIGDDNDTNNKEAEPDFVYIETNPEDEKVKIIPPDDEII